MNIKNLNLRKYDKLFLIFLLLVFFYCYLYLQLVYPKVLIVETYDKTIPLMESKQDILDYKILSHPVYYITIYFSHIIKPESPPKLNSVYIDALQDESNFTFTNRVTIKQRGRDYEFLKLVYPNNFEEKQIDRLKTANNVLNKLFGSKIRSCLYEFDNMGYFNKSTSLRCFGLKNNTVYNSLDSEEKQKLYADFAGANLTEIRSYLPPNVDEKAFTDIGDNILFDAVLSQYHVAFDYFNPNKNITYTVYNMPLEKNWSLFLLFNDRREDRYWENNFVYFDLNISSYDPIIKTNIRDKILDLFYSDKVEDMLKGRRYNYTLVGNRNCYLLIDLQTNKIENIYCIEDKGSFVEATLFILSCDKVFYCDKLSSETIEKEFYDFIESYNP